jgi:Domain of unknown function (DUF4157)
MRHLAQSPASRGIAAGGGVGPHLESAIDAARVGGRSLERSTRERLEPRLGASLAAVRVHDDNLADSLTRALSARAFAVGSDVFFAPGAYRPGSRAGDALIAHEATHVVQQRDGPAHGALTVSSPGDALEREAEAIASTISADARPAAHGLPAQRRAVASRSVSGVRTLARAPPNTPPGAGTPALVPPAVQEATTPLLNTMQIDASKAASFYRGEMVVGEIPTEGGDATIVFFQLKDGRLRAGIFSINVKADPTAALKAFSRFRGIARRLAGTLQVPEMELIGAAVANPDVEAVLKRQRFVKSEEPLPESLGARSGESIEVYSKRFPVSRAAAEGDVPRPPEIKPPAGPGTGAAGTTPQAPHVEEIKPPAGPGTGAAAEGVEASVEAGLGLEFFAAAVELVLLWAVQIAIESLKESFERERMERDMEAHRPQIEAQLKALDSKIAGLRRSSDVYARISIDVQYKVLAGAVGEGGFTGFYSAIDYERVTVLGVDVAGGRAPTSTTPPKEESLSHDASRQHNVISYSVVIDDSFTKARARAQAERARALEQMQRGRPPAPNEQSTVPAPPLLPSPGPETRHEPFTPLPGAPGASAYDQAMAGVVRARAITEALRAGGEALERRQPSNNPPTREERASFFRDEQEWRLAVTYWWEHYKDNPPDAARAAFDELLHSEKYGGRLAQIRDHLGG